MVSIVVPCHDVEGYIDECVASLISQTYSSIEILLVDDGATDSTPERIDRWAEKDPRIVPLHQENGGLGAARNAGVDAASGSYLFFLDADDMLPNDAIERLVDSASATGSDFVSGVVNRFDSTGSWRADQYRAPFDTDRSATHLFREPLLVYDQMACSKLFRREFWEREALRFPVGSLYEDLGLVMRAHCRARNVDLLASPTYLWRRREGADLSITQDRYRPGSTRARFDALVLADALLREEAPHGVWVEHGIKVMTVDIRLYSRLLEGGGEDFADEFLTSAGRLAESISSDAVASVSPVMREIHRALVARDVATLRACTRLLSGSDGRSIGRLATGVGQLLVRRPSALVRIGREVSASAIR